MKIMLINLPEILVVIAVHLYFYGNSKAVFLLLYCLVSDNFRNFLAAAVKITVIKKMGKVSLYIFLIAYSIFLVQMLWNAN